MEKMTQMWRLCSFRFSELTSSRFQHAEKKRRMIKSGGKGKFRGAIRKKKRQVGSKPVQKSFCREGNNHKCPRVLHCFSLKTNKATRSGPIVAPELAPIHMQGAPYRGHVVVL